MMCVGRKQSHKRRWASGTHAKPLIAGSGRTIIMSLAPPKLFLGQHLAALRDSSTGPHLLFTHLVRLFLPSPTAPRAKLATRTHRCTFCLLHSAPPLKNDLGLLEPLKNCLSRLSHQQRAKPLRASTPRLSTSLRKHKATHSGDPGAHLRSVSQVGGGSLLYLFPHPTAPGHSVPGLRRGQPEASVIGLPGFAHPARDLGVDIHTSEPSFLSAETLWRRIATVAILMG